MRKTALVTLAAAGLLLAPAGAAQAKEVTSLKICGASGCKESTDPEALRNWEPGTNSDPASVSSTAPEPFYTVELGFGDGQQTVHRETAYWLPRSGLMRFKSQALDPWWKIFPNQAALYKDVSAGVDPLTPRLVRATVAGRAVADPSSYLRLMGSFPSLLFPKGKLHLTHVVLRASEPNPWVDGAAALSFDAKRRILVRSDGYFRLPGGLVKLLTKRASLASSASSGSANGHTALYAGVGAGALVALAALGIVGRKRIH